MYQFSQPGATEFKLWFFIALMGCVTVMCAQVPTIHAQRMLNGVAMANTAGFSLMAVVLSIYQGLKYHTVKDYGRHLQAAESPTIPALAVRCLKYHCAL